MKFEDKDLITIEDLIGMNVIMPYMILGTNDSTNPYKITITEDGIKQLSKQALKQINEALQVNKKYSYIGPPAKRRSAYAYLSWETQEELNVFPKWEYPNQVDFEISFSVE